MLNKQMCSMSIIRSKKTICCPGLKPDMLNGFLMYIGSVPVPVPVPVHHLIDSYSPCELCELNRLRQSKGSWGARGQSSSWALCAVTLQRCVSEDLCSGRGHLSPHEVTVRQRRPYTQIPSLLQSCD